MFEARREEKAALRGFWGLVLAQFTGVFNDNAFRCFLIALGQKRYSDPGSADAIIATSAGLFLCPYLLFSMHAGSIADRYSKRQVLAWSKGAEAVILSIGAVFFLVTGNFLKQGNFALLYCLLFLLGAQATYYSPAKFGLLPELLSERLLSWGNGILEMTGFVAIVLGSVCGSVFIKLPEALYYLAPLTLTSVALLGLLANALMPQLPAADPGRVVKINPLGDLINHGGKLLKERVLRVTLLSVVYIWSLGLLFQQNITVFVREDLHFDASQIGLPLAAAAVGMGVGNVLAGVLSGKTIEAGIVPVASFGISICSMAFYFTGESIAHAIACILSIGLFAGLFVVPMHALLQEESAHEDKGGIWAATNFLQTLGMLLATLVFTFLRKKAMLSAPQIFLVTGAGTLAVLVTSVFFLPESFARTLFWFKNHFGFRAEVSGQDNLPPHGPLILFLSSPSNSLAFMVLAGTRRFVRFAFPCEARGFSGRLMHRMLQPLQFPLEPTPSSVDVFFGEVEKAIRKGDTVCLAVDASFLSALPPAARGAYEAGLASLRERALAPIVPVRLSAASESVAFEPPLPAADALKEA